MKEKVIATSKTSYSLCNFETILDESGKEILVGDSECSKNVNRTK
jgi:hypothetical protein